MQCPTDQTVLVMSERSGIEIDYCPQCRGVWLDRGELDKIIDRAESTVTPPPPTPQSAPQQEPQQAQPQYSQPQYSQPQYSQPYRKKKKEHWLTELFE